MGLVLRRNKGESIEIFDPSDESLGVIKVTARGRGNIEIDAPKQLTVVRSELLGQPIEPKPITKKLSEIMSENPSVRVWGVKRKTADCVLMLSWHWEEDEWSDLDMAWCDGAWSCRPASGVYQQVMIFVPEGDDE
jgi:sRNA-binding carbon storage regulator CsrA